MNDDFEWFDDDEEVPPETPEEAAMHQRSLEKATSNTRRAQPQFIARRTPKTELVSWDFNTRVMTLSVDGEEVLIDAIDSDLRYLRLRLTINQKYVAHYVKVSGKVVTQLLHRIIMERVLGRPLTRTEEIDHKDRNPRNNKRDNLRLATSLQNKWNKAYASRNNLGVRGVRKVKSGFAASIVIDKKSRLIGIYPTIEEAQAAYIEAVKKHRGEFAYWD